ncbi:MAG: methyltransferase family protein [Pirellulaceae bacterium]
MFRLALLLRTLAFPVIIAGIVFASAGRVDLPFVWAVCGVMAGFYVLLAAFTDPDLWRERQAPGSGNQDRLTQPLGGVLLLCHWVIAGLDVGRFHWSLVPWQVQTAGVVGFAAALAVNFWAMRVNRFYSSVVRVQGDRGQHPIMDGPYRFVRHPGYTATLFAMFCGGTALGSWLAMIPVMGFAILFIRRTLLEDWLLHEKLPGYVEYAERVRFRLVPWVF